MAIYRLNGALPIIPSDLTMYLSQMLSALGSFGQLAPNGVVAVIPPFATVKLLGTGLQYELAPGFPTFTAGTLKSGYFSYFGLSGLKFTDLNISAKTFSNRYDSNPMLAIEYMLSKSDIIYGASAADNVSAGDGADKIYGGAGNDTLLGFFGSEGGDGKDSIFGGAGRDTVVGGDANDLLSGGDAMDILVGGEGDDRAYGGDGGDSVMGDLGNDQLYGGVGGDTVMGGEGNDRIYGGGGSNVLIGDNGTDQIFGSSESDTLAGGNGNDRLFGGGGADVLDGSENADLMVGATGNDSLFGGNGNDTLRGGSGMDYLSGGGGNDRFVFDTGLSLGNIDTIDDFTIGQDLMLLDKSVFTGLTGTGPLSAAQFRLGSSAADASDRIIYDGTNGNLYYDPDGSGGKAAILIALLDSGLGLDGGDFRLIA
jgi:Ca2+-binding RTX toxin-like protein